MSLYSPLGYQPANTPRKVASQVGQTNSSTAATAIGLERAGHLFRHALMALL